MERGGKSRGDGERGGVVRGRGGGARDGAIGGLRRSAGLAVSDAEGGGCVDSVLGNPDKQFLHPRARRICTVPDEFTSAKHYCSIIAHNCESLCTKDLA